MNAVELLCLSRDICRSNLRRTSDAELLPLVRSGVNLMFMLSCGLLGTPADEAHLRSWLLDKVCPALRRRYARRTALADRWALLDARFRTLYYASPLYDARWTRVCDDTASFLAEVEPEADNLCGDALHAVLSAVWRLRYEQAGCEEVDAVPAGCARLADATLGAWAASLSDDGAWPGVEPAEALRRLRLLDMQATLPGGGVCEEVRTRALAHYCPLPACVDDGLPPDDARVRFLIRLFDVLELTTLRLPCGTARLLDALSASLARVPEHAAARAVVVACACRRVADELERDLMGCHADDTAFSFLNNE